MNDDHVDFGSSLYLGLRHPCRELRPWTQLTTGAPSVLRPTPGAAGVEERARRQLGVRAALIATSTLHALVDIHRLHPDRHVVLDEFAYPIAPLVAPPTAARFRHHDPRSLQRCLERIGRRALVIVDGWCTACGRAAPLAEYSRLVHGHGALLVVDDTQAWGVIGRGARPGHPIGVDGSGSVAACGLDGDTSIVTVASAAKAYGAPIAVVAGPTRIVERLRERGPTHTHCSQPSAAHIEALARAFDLDEQRGAQLRRRLDALTHRFTCSTRADRIRVRSGGFPVVSIEPPRHTSIHYLLARLRDVRVYPLVVRGHGQPLLTFIIRADHRTADIDRASTVVHSLLRTP